MRKEPLDGAVIALGCLGILLILGLWLALVPYVLMIVLNSFGVDISFWQTVGAWWLTTIIVNLFKGGKDK